MGHALDYGFDSAKRVTSVATTIVGITGAKTVSYQYDAAGNRTRLTWPESGTQAYYVNYSYDTLGRMSWATDSGSTTLATFTYNPLSRLTNIAYMGGGAATVDYTYSNAGDPLTVVNNLNLTANDNTFTYTYSNAHQTASLAASNSAWQWAPSTTSTTSYAAVNTLNQYPTVAGVTLSYDTRGNLTGDSTWTYTYDAENRLLTAAKSGVSATYAYDVLGRRTKKSGTGVTTTWFLSDGSDEIAEYDNGGLVRRFVPGPSIDRPIAMVTPTFGSSNTKVFFHTDRLGSVVELSNTNGAKTTEGPYTYDPYGQPSATTGEPYKFTGRRLDPETGLYYYRARYYSSALGRFLQTDPVGYKDDLNLYGYVGNNPTDKTDPTGLTCFDNCDLTSAAIAISAARQVGEAIANHPGETMQVVGNATSLIPSPPTVIAGRVVAGAGIITKELSGETSILSSTLKPDPNAGESIPASSSKVNSSEQRQVNRIGSDTGCHACGTKDPGTKSGNWVGDHQPATKLNPPGGPQRLYPHCLSCSRRQGGDVNKAMQMLKLIQPSVDNPEYINPMEP